MTTPQHWLPITPDLPLGDYEVMFEGGLTGRASKIKVGWIITQDSAHRPPEAGVVAYKKAPWKPQTKQEWQEEKLRLRK